MTSAITDRPRIWSQIVGQDRAIHMLKSIFTRARFLPKGFVFEGVTGIGKTTTAYVVAKSLMCTGEDPLSCSGCPSCLVFQEHPEHHPDFLMVDGASNSGVDAARRIVDAAMDLPTLARTRVVIIDEAHRLSEAAFDVYLTPLESMSLRCVFIFCTTEGRKIPKTTRGRCCSVRFSKVPVSDIQGLLTRIASKNNLEFEMDGLKAIARAAKGHVRDAVTMLDKVAGMGRITREGVALAVDLTLTDMALNALVCLATNRFTDACKELDAIARTYGAPRAVEEVFSAYGRAVFGDPDATPEEERHYRALRGYFPNPADVTATLIKWSATDRLPSDALPLFAHELAQHVNAPVKAEAPAAKKLPPCPAPEEHPQLELQAPVLSTEDLANVLGGKVLK